MAGPYQTGFSPAYRNGPVRTPQQSLGIPSRELQSRVRRAEGTRCAQSNVTSYLRQRPVH
ncbi:hypothetical protein XAP412_250127 [Xanthomonas phaseoli pv. phaseoli]|uniref:Uncharacterized protein n=1 Tax=Xanthomonas campestris pv. phaseoli TaxID=317013 RepID=A0AB38DYB8_XANCH|nr:hypothetical protein XAP6984_310212 [Xanthomonas phaseoli pv. phaseoli]SON82495.1 hypothetical protein XAP412_250127 [Xanthomonas phaseoli pv. phaseoli]SON86621.1 hypothetical protein XAP7430_260211 [Xanthomonas phaseoli pv. phaseoli]